MPGSDDLVSRKELERQIWDLKREKSRIQDNIRRMEANQKRAEDIAARRQASPVPESAPSPKKRKESDDKDDKDKDDEDGKEGDDKENETVKGEAEGEGEEKQKRKSSLPTNGKKPDARSRAMFGKLLGHLQSAKTRLDSEKGWKSHELNKQAHAKLEQKLSAQKMGIHELNKEQYKINRREEEAKAIQIDKTIEEKELLLLQKRLESHYSNMMNFIRTRAEPTIFYLPAKQTKTTEKLLEETRGAIKHKIASLKVQLQPPAHDDQDGSAEAAARASAAAAAEKAAEEQDGKDDKDEVDAEEDKEEEDKEDKEDREDREEEEDDEEASIPGDAPKTTKEAEEMEAAEASKEDEKKAEKRKRGEGDGDDESADGKNKDDDDEEDGNKDAPEAKEQAEKDDNGDEAQSAADGADEDEESPKKKAKKDSDSE